MQSVMQTFLYLFYLLIKKINWYLLTCATNAASFAHFQLGASNSKTNILKTEELLFETNMKLFNMRLKKIKI